MSVTQDEKSAARSPDGQGSVEATHPGASPEGEHRHFKARRDWLSPERAKAYRESRRPSQYARYYTEEAILVPWLEDLPRHARILDVPCGTGRWIPALTGRGYRYVGADVSPHMVREARQLTGPPAVSGLLVADLAHLPFPDESFDAVILWRLLHHVPDSPTRKRLLAEAARVSRYKVILSFHHPYSITYVTKVIRRTLFGFKQGGRGITHWQLKEEAATAGLTVLETRSFWKYASINWFACLAKTSTLNDAGRVR